MPKPTPAIDYKEELQFLTVNDVTPVEVKRLVNKVNEFEIPHELHMKVDRELRSLDRQVGRIVTDLAYLSI